jgi:hypothetical protein
MQGLEGDKSLLEHVLRLVGSENEPNVVSSPSHWYCLYSVVA